MSFEDFKDYFSSVTICRINDNYAYNYFKSKHLKNSHNVIRLEVVNPGFTYISANQMERHCFSKNFEYEYSNCRIIIAKESETGLVYVTGKQGFDRNLWLGLELESGAYQIYVEYEWRANIKHFVISTYGDAQVTFSSLGEVSTFITEVYSAKALLSGAKVPFANNPDLVKYHELLPEGYGYFFIVNQSDKTLIEKCYFKTFKNLQFLSPYNGSKYEVKIASGDSAIIIIKTIVGQKPSLSFTSTIVSDSLETSAPVENPLELKVKTEGTLEQRLHPETEEEIGVQVYTLKDSDSMFVLYENTSNSTVYEESVEYTLRNAKIVGVDGKEVSFKLNPGDKFFIELKSTGKSWSVKSSCSYTIS